MEAPPLVDYADMIREYGEFVAGSVRGYEPPAEYLAMWMPAENHVGAVVNMVVAARDWGEEAVAIRVPSELFSDGDLAALDEQLGAYGAVEIERKEDGGVILVELVNENA